MKILAKAIGMAVSASFILTACGGEASQIDTWRHPKSIQSTILALESSGKSASLNRSESIAGPDANENGIRDDVDAFIGKQGYTSPKLKSVQQNARAIANIFHVNINNRDELIASDLNLQKSINCIFSKFSDSTQSAEVIKNIEIITVNTRSRVEAYMKYQIAFNGKVLASPQGDTCE